MKRFLLVLFVVCASCSLTLAAPAPAPTSGGAAPAAEEVQPGHSLHGEAFDEGPRHAAVKLGGMGQVHFPVTTSKPEAQVFFDQGVAQLHTYYYYEAERSFRQVLKIDPGCAMAYWGMAMANQNNAKRARAFLAKAEALRPSLTERERKHLDALAALYKEGVPETQHQADYIQGLEAVVAAYPDDIEAKAFLAGVLINSGPPSRAAVDALIEAVLQKQPMHPGAHHYRIHLWDGRKPEQALLSAQAYAKTAPGIAHAWHMPGHIFNGLSRWREAAYQQEASARVDHGHVAQYGLMPCQIHNYAHNEHYLIANLSHLGRVRDAIAFSRNLVETPRDPQLNNPRNGSSAQRLGRASLMRIYVRYERWDDLLTDPLLDWSNLPEEQAWKAYSRGLAYLGKGDTEKARAEAAALDKLASDAAAAKPPAPGKDLMETARLELRGRLDVAAGNTIEGFELLNRGAELGRRFSGDLAGYPRPFMEALGQAHLQAHNWGLAEACFRKVLESRKNTLVSLAGLVEACARGGKSAAAQAAWRDFEAASTEADPDLPLRGRLTPLLDQRRTTNDQRPGPALVSLVNAPTSPPADPSLVDGRSSLVVDPKLGPKLWAPSPAAPFALADAAGKAHALEEYRGHNLVLVFYLGGGCAHCMEQLKTLGKEAAAIEALDTRIAAVSGDTPQRNRELLATPAGAGLPATLLSDINHEIAHRYLAWDDFEDLPLHATFLIDRDGKVRWHHISADPFTDFTFLKEELARVNRLTGRPQTGN
jgi:peroxiredoxin